jgi:hypothetical protein
MNTWKLLVGVSDKANIAEEEGGNNDNRQPQ